MGAPKYYLNGQFGRFYKLPLVYILLCITIIISIYYKIYPLEGPTWGWFVHDWEGLGGAPATVVLLIALFAGGVTLLIHKRSKWLWPIGLFSTIAFALFIYPPEVWISGSLTVSNASYMSVANSQIDYPVNVLLRRYEPAILSDNLPNYHGQIRYGNSATHPPLSTVLFYYLERIAISVKDHTSITNIIGMVLLLKAVLNSLGGIALYYIGKTIGGKFTGYAAAALFFVSPGLILFNFYPDVFYLLLFALGWLFLIKSEKYFSLIWLTALLTAIAAFFSFGCLILYIFWFMWLVIRVVQKEIKWQRAVDYLLIMVLVFLMLVVFFQYNYGYNYYTGWLTAQVIHAGMTGDRSLHDWFWLNFADVALFASCPTVLLSACAYYKVRKEKNTLIKAILLIYPLIFLLLNLSGITKGEVGRIWYFMDVTLFIAAAVALLRLPKEYRYILLILALFFNLLTMLYMHGVIHPFLNPMVYNF